MLLIEAPIKETVMFQAEMVYLPFSDIEDLQYQSIPGFMLLP